MVCSGQEGFLVQLGAFNYLGADALLQSDYVPDFSAKVINYAKLLKIKRIDYMSTISHIINFDRWFIFINYINLHT